MKQNCFPLGLITLLWVRMLVTYAAALIRFWRKSVLDVLRNTFSEISLEKWKDGLSRKKIEWVLPKMAEGATRVGD